MSKIQQTVGAGKPERRFISIDAANCEVRAAEEGGTPTFVGYAAVFGELSVNLGGFRERIHEGCFRDAVTENQDVRFLINHDSNLVLGRTRSKTVELAEDKTGLRVECGLPDTTYARDLQVSMERGDIDQMSFGFVTRADDWKEKDPETGLPIRELLRADLFDVSVVTYPAYGDTTASIRSAIEEENPELLERAARAAEELPDPEKPEDDDEEKPEGDDTPEDGEEKPEDEDEGEERVGKTISAKNAAALSEAKDQIEAVLNTIGGEPVELLSDPAPEAEQRDPNPVPVSVQSLREFVASLKNEDGEVREWDYDDDWGVWSVTNMLTSASCFLLYADDAQKGAMGTILKQLAEVLGSIVADVDLAVGEEREKPAEEEQREEVESETARLRRELDLRELEFDVATA